MTEQDKKFIQKRATEILFKLVQLKKYKEIFGIDDHYENNKKIAWKEGSDLMNTLSNG